MWVKNGLVLNKISVPSTILCIQKVTGLTKTAMETPCHFLDTISKNCINDEILIIFISDLEYITF